MSDTTKTRTPTEKEFTSAIEKLDEVYGSTAEELIELIETVRDEETVHTTEARDAFVHTDDCTGCLTERIADAVTRAVTGEVR
jgi:hypothetical protein